MPKRKKSRKRATVMFPAVIQKRKKSQSWFCNNFAGNLKKCLIFCQRIARKTSPSQNCFFLCSLSDQPFERVSRSSPGFGFADCFYPAERPTINLEASLFQLKLFATESTRVTIHKTTNTLEKKSEHFAHAYSWKSAFTLSCYNNVRDLITKFVT